LSSWAPWSYIVSNVCLVPDYFLSSVFAANPDPSANGSLWTLPVEMRAYILLAVLGLAGLVRRRLICVAAVSLIALNVAMNIGPSLRLMSIFVGGSALYLLRDSVMLRLDIATLLLAVWLAAYNSRFAAAVGIVVLPYLVVYAAYCTPARLRRLTAKGDVSYGVYVYAFPIQQSIVAIAGLLNPLLLTVIAAPIVWSAGFMSWRLIEAPMLRLKYARLTGRTRERAPAADAASAQTA
jgi:peptidoglycan/LPS O-acetylase OafA/YrhL